MKKSAYQQRLEAAIEARETLDTPEIARLAMLEGQRIDWEKQVRLDQAITAWQRQSRVTGRRPLGWQTAAVVAATALGLTGLWFVRSSESPLSTDMSNVEQIAQHEPAAPMRNVAATESLVAALPSESIAAPRPVEPDRFAQATETAERLAMAIQPVGEEVGSMFNLLFDAVPGSDLLAM